MTNAADQTETAGALSARQLAPRIYARRARQLALRIQLRARYNTLYELAPRQIAATRVNGRQA